MCARCIRPVSNGSCRVSLVSGDTERPGANTTVSRRSFSLPPAKISFFLICGQRIPNLSSLQTIILCPRPGKSSSRWTPPPHRSGPGPPWRRPQKLKNSPVATLFAEQVATPEKSMERRPMLRRAAGNDAVALSVNEARRAALGLRRPDKGRVDEDALESVEQKLGVGAGAGRLPVKRKPDVRLPERYEILCDYFNGFDSSTRLLRAKGCRATFPNICTVIQILAGRKFTYRNLAQLKYIMPEAIVINKILLCDEKTCCMKPDLQVNLLVDAVVGSVMQKGESRYLTLRKIFRQRLVDFFRNHPEGDDIPEHELPHPFTQKSAQITQRVLPEAESVMPLPCLAEQQPVAVSHMAHAFKGMFSKRSSTSSSTDSITSPMANGEFTASSTLNRKLEESHVQDKSGQGCWPRGWWFRIDTCQVRFYTS